MPLKYKEKYFNKDNGLYFIDHKIKQSISFRKHNLFQDTYPQNIDIIVCRNVVIYFTDKAKSMIFMEMSNSLATNRICL